jgi:dTDP-4-dehydrorhamnose reductase
MNYSQTVVVFGAFGQLGSALRQALLAKYNVVAVARSDLDIGNTNDVHTFLDTVQPHLVINALAYTDVQGAEQNKERCSLANATFPAEVSKACERNRSYLIHISTDYVFNGQKGRPYSEWDLPLPVNFYGLSKYMGEQAVAHDSLILRTSWLYGGWTGKNFFLLMKRLAEKGEPVRMVSDQFGSPTHVDHLIEVIMECLEQRPVGLYHAACEGVASWYDLAQHLNERHGFKLKIEKAKSCEFKRKVEVPTNTALDSEKLAKALGSRFNKHWREY